MDKFKRFHGVNLLGGSGEDVEKDNSSLRPSIKKPLPGKTLDITGPTRVKHKLHVDKELNWTGTDSVNSIELLQKLGEGAYGAVYKAMHTGANSIIAVKCVPISADSEQGEDIKKEIDILRECRHDNIVSLYGCMFNHTGDLWILMDFCGCGSLKDFAKKFTRPLNEDEIVAILYFVVKGLCYLHAKDIIHRDLKPANILLTEEGDVKIADFGVSFCNTQAIKGSNAVVGTPLFLSPEALSGQVYSSASDIWSVGISAIEMVDGVPPYYEDHIMRAMLMITQGDPPTVQKPAQSSDAFNNFVARCLKKDQNERPSAQELLEDPLFVNKDHARVLMMMMAEYKILRMKSAPPTSTSSSSSSKSSSASGSTPGTSSNPGANFSFGSSGNNEDTESEDGSETENEKEHGLAVRLRRGTKFKNLEKKQEKKSVDLRTEKFSFTDAELKAAGEQMAMVLRNLEKQLDVEKTFTSETDIYAAMSFSQLVDEINEMKDKEAKLKKKLSKLTPSPTPSSSSSSSTSSTPNATPSHTNCPPGSPPLATTTVSGSI